MNSSRQQSCRKTDNVTKIKEMLANLEIDEEIKNFSLKTTEEINSKLIEKIKLKDNVVQRATEKDFELGVQNIKRELVNSHLKSLLNSALNSSSIISKRSINSSAVVGEAKHAQSSSISNILIKQKSTEKINNRYARALMTSVERESDDYITKNKSQNYSEAIVVRSLNKSKNNDVKVKPNFIDEEYLYGNVDFKPLTNQRRNQSYTNLQNASNSTFENFITRLKKEKLERNKRRRHQLQMLKKKHHEESERKRIELENSEIK